jgi:hypothetical protein
MDSFPEARRGAGSFTNGPTKGIQEIKNGLTLQVARQQGAFWEEICKTRARWSIQAPTQFPPADTSLLYPEQLLTPKAESTETYFDDCHNWGQDIERLALWLAVPGLQRYREKIDWLPFMAALVLYQPPLDSLQEFAGYGGIIPKIARYRRKKPTKSHDPMLVEPLIHRLPHPYAIEWQCELYYETLMKEINERYLMPRGLDIRELRAKIVQEGTVEGSLKERLQQVPADLYVEVTEEASVDELRKAVGRAKSMNEDFELTQDLSSVKASTKTLIQVELAYRYYCRGENYLDVSERYLPNIESAETAKKYASLGRSYLPEDVR